MKFSRTSKIVSLCILATLVALGLYFSIFGINRKEKESLKPVFDEKNQQALITEPTKKKEKTTPTKQNSNSTDTSKIISTSSPRKSGRGGGRGGGGGGGGGGRRIVGSGGSGSSPSRIINTPNPSHQTGNVVLCDNRAGFINHNKTSCFFIATFQALFSLTKIIRFLPFQRITNQNQVLFELIDLFRKIGDPSRSPINPNSIKNLLHTKFNENNIVASNQFDMIKTQHDASEFFLKFLELLETEIRNFQNSPNFNQVPFHLERNSINNLNDFKDAFFTQIQIISSINVFGTREDYLSAIPLEVGEPMLQSFNSLLNDESKISFFLSPPKVLTVMLKRFKIIKNRTVKINSRFEYLETLDLTRHYIAALREGVNYPYLLQSVIIHKGSNSKSGHYYTYTRDFDNPTVWFKADDEQVSVVTKNEVDFDGFGGNGNTCAYILVYVRADVVGYPLSSPVVIESPQIIVAPNNLNPSENITNIIQDFTANPNFFSQQNILFFTNSMAEVKTHLQNNRQDFNQNWAKVYLTELASKFADIPSSDFNDYKECFKSSITASINSLNIPNGNINDNLIRRIGINFRQHDEIYIFISESIIQIENVETRKNAINVMISSGILLNKVSAAILNRNDIQQYLNTAAEPSNLPECVICMDVMDITERSQQELAFSCATRNHLVHKDCLQNVSNNVTILNSFRCPTCRENFDRDSFNVRSETNRASRNSSLIVLRENVPYF